MSSTAPPERALADAAARGLDVALRARPARPATAATGRAGTNGGGTDGAGADTAGTDAAGTDGGGTDAAGTDGLVPVKTIVLHRRDGFVFVLVPLGERFSWPKLRAALGVNRVRLPSEEEAYLATGYRRGTITPLGASTAFPVVADRRILGHDITLGSGSPDHAVSVRADDLVRAYDATVVDLAPAPGS
ncbi:aminoacyl-tRNA deacylase [Myceligenerans pegani]|uniref:YbaK/EbsC family protein n=1 Tax=Myceligenerans pegani TaxID=2776917 RepID=A0ABR9N5V5_9MICO|nr:YbaK/EbsC family protein [Myceligenerans sp. TRM 65318]MBE1878392.1 YbaK/EbsC family protein [Myceligenerans sp. TRM 65318]MBE3020663.1 YbaK/EbsC family protein [Myceligenerans sp. TRM 65318]